MAGSSIPIHGVGTGQPTRPDFEGSAHHNVLRPGQNLDIPKQTVDGARSQREAREGHTAATGWARQEQAFAKGAGYEQGGAKWNDFAGGHRNPGSNFGTVRVDDPTLAPHVDKTPHGGAPKDWAQSAAMLEEKFRANGEKVGIDTELKLPGHGPVHAGPKGTGRNNGRRQFTLVT